MPASPLLRRPAALPLLVALAATLAAMAFNVGRLPPDPHTRYLVAESLVRDGDLEIEPSLLTVQDPAGATGPDARTYSVFQPGQTVLFLPVAAAAEAGRRLLGGPESIWTDAGSFAASMLLVAPLAGLLVLGHVRLLEDFGLSVRAASASGLLLAFGTAHWVWATAGSEEIVLGACGTWAWLLGRRGVRRAEAGDDTAAVRALGLAGVLLAVGICHRLTFGSIVLGWLILVLPGLWAALGPAPGTGRDATGGTPSEVAVRLRARRTTGLAVRLLPWFLAACSIVALVPIYNALRFGDPFDTGYARYYEPFGGLWATPLLEGLGGLLASPGKSVFLHSPWLVLVVPALLSGRVRRTLGTPMVAGLLLASVLHFLVYARTTFWAGGLGFGVRFHVSILPLWLVPIAIWTDGVVATARPQARRLAIGLLASLALASVLVQGVGLTLNTGYAYLADPDGYDELDGRIPRAAAWDPARSPIVIRSRAIVRKLAGEDILPPGEPESKRLQASWNVFPVRASVTMPDRAALLGGLWAGWAVLLGLLAGSLVLVIRAWRATDSTVRSGE